MRSNSLDVNSDTGNQTTSANTTEDGLELAQICLAHNLHTDSALTSDNVRVVEGGNVCKAVGLGKTCAFSLGLVKVVAM